MLDYLGRKPKGRAVGYKLGKEAIKVAKRWGYQVGYQESITCKKCGGTAILAILFDDKRAIVADDRPKGAKIWPHDCMSVGNYICTECGEISSEWDQG